MSLTPGPGIRKKEKEFKDWIRQQSQEFFTRLRELVRAYSGYPWFFKKEWQTFARTRLLHVMAIIMVFIVAFRERNDLIRMMWELALARLFCELRLPGVSDWAVLAGMAGTLYVAVIELSGIRRTTSRQELRFQSAMKDLFVDLQKLAATEGTVGQIEKQYQDFVRLFLNAASDTFSGQHQVDTGLMVIDEGGKELKLKGWSTGAIYDQGLSIKVPGSHGFPCTGPTCVGPAGVAYAEQALVYLPQKKWDKPKKAWPFKAMEVLSEKPTFSYEALDAHHCWIQAKEENLEAFYSVICTPIKDLGVLNFSTAAKDPFISRDFFMAECFAVALGLARTIVMEKRARKN